MIPLYLENNVAYVWNSEDWHKLRYDNRICGSLIGGIPSYPRQNDFLGLPMALMSEEAALLVEKGICELFSIPKLLEKPSEETKQSFKELEKRQQEEQNEVLKKKKIEQITKKVDIIIAGKKRKLLSKGIQDVDIDKQSLLQEEIDKVTSVSQNYLLVHIPTEHNIEIERVKASIEHLKPSVLDGEGFVKFAIFKDLWHKGHFITDGLKFGCDYLVYPGDPVRFHAMYMVRCMTDQSIACQPSSLVAFGRLAVSVNKVAVLAALGDSEHIVYQTIQWHDSVHG